MLLLQLFFVCITAGISLCTVIGDSKTARGQTSNSSQKNETDLDIDALIDSIFETQQTTEHQKPVVHADCKCVPYYLCNDTAVADAAGTIDVHVRSVIVLFTACYVIR